MGLREARRARRIAQFCETQPRPILSSGWASSCGSAPPHRSLAISPNRKHATADHGMVLSTYPTIETSATVTRIMPSAIRSSSFWREERMREVRARRRAHPRGAIERNLCRHQHQASRCRHARPTSPRNSAITASMASMRRRSAPNRAASAVTNASTAATTEVPQ